MRLKLIPITVLLLFLSGSLVFGSVVGKITGEITDGDSDQPVVGATVAVQGTDLGGVADQDGVYTIHNVPVGAYTLVITAVGFANVEISNVEVSADLASYHDMAMSSKAADLGTTIKVTAERPMVIKDKTTTVNIIKRDELLSMPTRGMEQVVGIQNSVVRANSGSFTTRNRGQRPGAESATGQELNLRGGRPSEVAYYVDGFSQQDPLTGASTAKINQNAIKEISVTSGAFSAEYGHVSSGIVNVVTNSGSSDYHGNVEVVTDNVLSENYDHNYYTADIGGPVPGLENAFFFLSGERRFLRDRTPSSMTKDMHEAQGMEFGLDTLYEDDPQRLPANSHSGWSYQGKIDYRMGPNTKLQFSGTGSQDFWREYRQQWALNTEHMPRFEDKNIGLNAKIVHTLNANTFFNLSGSYFMTERLRGDGVVFDDYEAYERQYIWDDGWVSDVSNPEYDEYDLFWITDEDLNVFSRPDTTITGTDTVITIDTTVVNRDSYYGGYLHRKSAYIGVKGDWNSQVDERNTLKFGFDFQRHTLRYFRNLDATKGFHENRVNRYGFDSLGNESDDEGIFNDTKHPINLGTYIQDRFEWRGVIINAGLRFDYFDYKTKRIKDSINPMILGDDEKKIDEEDLEDSEKFYRVSPRLGVSFPVSDVTQMYMNFGKFYQRPDLDKLYVGYDFWGERVGAGSYFPFANPGLKPEKTTQYEVGVTHQLAENLAFTIGAYYKDIQDLTQIHTVDSVGGNLQTYSIFDNIDYGTIKGLDVSMTMRRTRNVRLDLKYTLSYATGTGSYAQTGYVINWSNPKGTPKTTNPLAYDQRHNFTGLFDMRLGRQEGPQVGDVFPLENTNLNFILYAGSGTPYTPLLIDDEVTEAAFKPTPRAGVNSATKPWIFQLDVKLERSFRIGNYDLIPYVWVKNLFDRENVIGVYEGTGEPGTTGYLGTPAGQTAAASGDYQERYELKQFNATNWSNPRMVFVGMRASF
ncbi:MAG: TonB-dependent receptor [candidate division Zixibacteria bacterium]|nr:TonB-dependent receptor [candidate division Zixibacteria bacterium]MDH3938914.1 TonB-dependent receptor [candidate division Zixibacteria bacterium]MDH4032365.1 TonB-dependent receptor [candidate division Zixibacteria bacterium]